MGTLRVASPPLSRRGGGGGAAPATASAVAGAGGRAGGGDGALRSPSRGARFTPSTRSRASRGPAPRCGAQSCGPAGRAASTGSASSPARRPGCSCARGPRARPRAGASCRAARRRGARTCRPPSPPPPPPALSVELGERRRRGALVRRRAVASSGLTDGASSEGVQRPLLPEPRRTRCAAEVTMEGRPERKDRRTGSLGSGRVTAAFRRSASSPSPSSCGARGSQGSSPLLRRSGSASRIRRRREVRAPRRALRRPPGRPRRCTRFSFFFRRFAACGGAFAATGCRGARPSGPPARSARPLPASHPGPWESTGVGVTHRSSPPEQRGAPAARRKSASGHSPAACDRSNSHRGLSSRAAPATRMRAPRILSSAQSPSPPPARLKRSGSQTPA